MKSNASFFVIIFAKLYVTLRIFYWLLTICLLFLKMSFPTLCCGSQGDGSFLIGVCRDHASSATSSPLPRAHFIAFSHCMRNPCWDFNGNYIKPIHQCGGNCHLYSVDPPHSWTSSLCFSNFISSAILNFFFNIQHPHTFCWVHNRRYDSWGHCESCVSSPCLSICY